MGEDLGALIVAGEISDVSFLELWSHLCQGPMQSINHPHWVPKNRMPDVPFNGVAERAVSWLINPNKEQRTSADISLCLYSMPFTKTFWLPRAALADIISV